MPFQQTTRQLGVESEPYYESRRLRGYDTVVVKVSNKVLWRCPKERLVEHYNEHVTGHHLEVGVGSGYYLDHCVFPADHPDLTLLDLNPDPLRFVASRIERYGPKLVQADVLAMMPPLEGGGFASIGLNYVLHCLRASSEGKEVVFENLVKVLAPGGVLFGSTILTEGVHHTALSRAFNRLYQRQGSFCNADDSLRWLRESIDRHFASYSIEVRGSVALFAARSAAPGAPR